MSRLTISITAPPSDEVTWNQADAIVAALANEVTGLTNRAGSTWHFDYSGPEGATPGQAISDIERRLRRIKPNALEILRVEHEA